jgi:hypothetical protein
MNDCQYCCKKITTEKPHIEKVVIDDNGNTIDILYCNKKCFNDKKKNDLKIRKKILSSFI